MTPTGHGMAGITVLPDLPSEGGALQLWLIDLRAPTDPGLWQACSAEEHAQAGRFRFERDARRYQAAHGQMRGLLAHALGCAPAELAWHTNTHGKPLLQGHTGWHFNLSHSGEWALLGLSQGAEIGVDIECHRDGIELDSLVQAHFTADEAAAWQAGPESERLTRFYRTWVCKEAGLKALGTGLSLPPQCVPTHWQPSWVHSCIETPAGPVMLNTHGLLLPIQGEAVQAAVAVRCA